MSFKHQVIRGSAYMSFRLLAGAIIGIVGISLLTRFIGPGVRHRRLSDPVESARAGEISSGAYVVTAFQPRRSRSGRGARAIARAILQAARNANGRARTNVRHPCRACGESADVAAGA